MNKYLFPGFRKSLAPVQLSQFHADLQTELGKLQTAALDGGVVIWVPCQPFSLPYLRLVRLLASALP